MIIGRQKRPLLAIIGLTAAYIAACRLSPAFARLALRHLALPAMAALHRLTAGVPFPVAEPLALLLAAGLALGLLRAGIHAAARRRLLPLGRWLQGALWAMALAGGALSLLWCPARALPADPIPTPDADRLEWLCDTLIDALNAAPLSFPGTADSLARAPEVAGLPGGAVKAARYPEWMDALRVSGLFVPLTGEALVNAASPPPLAPFSAVHELAHLSGVADEGAANVAAWRACLRSGGAFADSARLWALRYALGLLGRADPVARQRMYARMGEALFTTLRECNGEAAIRERPAPVVPGLSLVPGDYAALAGWLAAHPEAL